MNVRPMNILDELAFLAETAGAEVVMFYTETGYAELGDLRG